MVKESVVGLEFEQHHYTHTWLEQRGFVEIFIIYDV